MGVIWSKFRKKEPTKEKLRKIHEEIQGLQKYKEITEQRGKKLVGSLVAYSIFSYLLAAVICYFYYFPPTFEKRLLYATPFVGGIIIIYFIQKLLTHYYRWKVRRNEDHLSTLKEKKSEILDQVMETETYKVAKEILELYAPEQIRKNTMTIKSPLVTPVSSSQRLTHPGGELRRRIVPSQTSVIPSRSPTSTHSTGAPSTFPFSRVPMTPHTSQQQGVRPNFSNSSHQGPRILYSSVSPKSSHPYIRTEGGSVPPHNVGGEPPPGPPMPRPILPRERGILDRFVEYLVGDGPANRYALVCRQCESHNGMALKEEFPYIAFRCAYCFYWNPARKQKPAAPRLETTQHRASVDMQRKILLNEEESSSSEEEEESESDSSSASNSSSDERKETLGAMDVTNILSNKKALNVSENVKQKPEEDLPSSSLEEKVSDTTQSGEEKREEDESELSSFENLAKSTEEEDVPKSLETETRTATS